MQCRARADECAYCLAAAANLYFSSMPKQAVFEKVKSFLESYVQDHVIFKQKENALPHVDLPVSLDELLEEVSLGPGFASLWYILLP